MAELKYKTFSQLMSGIEQDLNNFTDEGFVDRGKYIKEARKVNEDLGLKINRERETVLDVKDFKTQLPEDFQELQLALACHVTNVSKPIFRGDQTEARSRQSLSETHTIDGETLLKTRHFNPSECMEGRGQDIWITKKLGIKIETFTHLDKLRVTNRAAKRCTDTCFNRRFQTHNVIDIEGDEATFSFREGKVYMNYLADMISDDGDILILDHPKVNDYYEYAIKKKFFENMKFNKEGDFLQDFQIAKQELKEARISALLFVNTVEYDEIIKTHLENRKRFYRKYIDYFDDLKDGYYQI
jgi:hypothetical protein